MGIARCFGGSGRDMGDLPGDWIWRVLVAVKFVPLVAGRRDAVVEARVGEVVCSEGVYFEKERRRRGIGSTQEVVELIILLVSKVFDRRFVEVGFSVQSPLQVEGDYICVENHQVGKLEDVSINILEQAKRLKSSGQGSSALRSATRLRLIEFAEYGIA